MMEEAIVTELVKNREYKKLHHYAEMHLESNDWSDFMTLIGYGNSKGKNRDAIVSLLDFNAIGGTDSNLFKEFSDLEGTALHQIQAHAVERAIEILKEQIENKHTYFLDIETMAETPYAILVKDVIEARKRELAELDSRPSRIEVLGTFYGFMILLIDGAQPRDTSINQQGSYRYRYYGRRTWLDDNISDSAVSAVKKLTGDFAEEVDMDKTYRTLGSSQIFKGRCTPTTAEILANAVRMSLYKVPGNRSSAALALGRTGDSRVLPFLHQRIAVDPSRKVRKRIAQALGSVGHVDSLEILKDQINYRQRNITKDQEAVITAIGGIYSSESKAILLEIAKNGGNTVKATAIQAMGTQDPEGLVDYIKPYLKDRSRPVVRASVLALFELGKDGTEAINGALPVILSRIGNDRPSHNAVIKVLSIPGVSQKRYVQEHFAKRISKQRREVERWSKRAGASSYSWWYRRREQRVRRNIMDVIKLVNRYLKPPFQRELLDSVEGALLALQNITDVRKELGQTELARAIVQRLPFRFEQTYLKS